MANDDRWSLLRDNVGAIVTPAVAGITGQLYLAGFTGRSWLLGSWGLPGQVFEEPLADTLARGTPALISVVFMIMILGPIALLAPGVASSEGQSQPKRRSWFVTTLRQSLRQMARQLGPAFGIAALLLIGAIAGVFIGSEKAASIKRIVMTEKCVSACQAYRTDKQLIIGYAIAGDHTKLAVATAHGVMMIALDKLISVEDYTPPPATNDKRAQPKSLASPVSPK